MFKRGGRKVGLKLPLEIYIYYSWQISDELKTIFHNRVFFDWLTVSSLIG